MWNAFDFSFILVFIAYLCLRIKGLHYNERSCASSPTLNPCSTSCDSRIVHRSIRYSGLRCLHSFPSVCLPAIFRTEIHLGANNKNSLVFFAVANHVIILYVRSYLLLLLVLFIDLVMTRSIQAMIVQFVIFLGTVAVCFSGLFFTLWTLGMYFAPHTYPLFSVDPYPTLTSALQHKTPPFLTAIGQSVLLAGT
jgi:hypothetical protein